MDKNQKKEKKRKKLDNVVLLPKKFVKFQEIKLDGEKRAHYATFGIFSVLESLAAVLFSIFVFAATFLRIDNALLFIILQVVFYTLATAVPLVFLIHSLIDLILQFRLNKQPISFTALLFFIVCTVGTILVFLGGLGMLS